MPIRGGQIINISGANPVDDPEYRYKMPAVFGKIEGSGNGIKTAIPNITNVAFSLHRDPGEVNKFFGCELGAQTTYNEETDRAIVNGAHTDDTLQKLIHRYVEGFVICPTCGLVRSIDRSFVGWLVRWLPLSYLFKSCWIWLFLFLFLFLLNTTCTRSVPKTQRNIANIQSFFLSFRPWCAVYLNLIS